jgi:hypothetical protein
LFSPIHLHAPAVVSHWDTLPVNTLEIRVKRKRKHQGRLVRGRDHGRIGDERRAYREKERQTERQRQGERHPSKEHAY